MSLDQKCKKIGTSATCCAIPKAIWRKFADHPAKSLRARLGPEALAGAPPLPRESTGSSIKAETSLASRAGYQPDGEMSIVDKARGSVLLPAGVGIGR